MTAAFSFIATLAESQLFSSVHSLSRATREEIGELAVLTICALRILLVEPDSAQAARRYAENATWGDFRHWRTDANDLAVLLYALVADNVTLKPSTETARHTLRIEPRLLHDWLQAAANDRSSRSLTRQVFSRLDPMFRITSASVRAVRREVMDWPDLSRAERRTCGARLLALLRAKALRGDLTDRLATALHALPRHDDGDAADHDHHKRRRPALENASAGATAAASVATVAGGLGVGFDPNGDWGVYAKRPAPPVLRRRKTAPSAKS